MISLSWILKSGQNIPLSAGGRRGGRNMLSKGIDGIVSMVHEKRINWNVLLVIRLK